MSHRHPSAPSRILVAVRTQDDDPAVVQYAAELARSFGSALILVGVATIMPVPSPTTPTFETLEPEAQQEEQELVDRLAREHLEELESACAPQVATESVLKWGAPGPATVEAAHDHRADLVVVPMRARDHELGHALHDHADRHVLHHCHVPVLVIPTST
jgi:nucleotide-binding universal stress UspA family protein